MSEERAQISMSNTKEMLEAYQALLAEVLKSFIDRRCVQEY